MYVLRNTEVLSCNHCCSLKVTRITYSERVFVALGTQHAMRMRHIICPVPLYNIFFHKSHKRYDFRENVTDNKVCVLILSTTFI